MNKREIIDNFFESEKFALAGVSRNEHKFGTTLFKEMKKRGLSVVGVNPYMTEILGSPCFPAIEDLPHDVDALITVVKPEEALTLIEAAHKRGIRKIWMQQGSQSEKAAAFCREKGINLIEKECLFMYLEPVESIHKFHRGIKKIFGGYHRPATS
jgi:predicted CoA-binding protein